MQCDYCYLSLLFNIWFQSDSKGKDKDKHKEHKGEHKDKHKDKEHKGKDKEHKGEHKDKDKKKKKDKEHKKKDGHKSSSSSDSVIFLLFNYLWMLYQCTGVARLDCEFGSDLFISNNDVSGRTADRHNDQRHQGWAGKAGWSWGVVLLYGC